MNEFTTLTSSALLLLRDDIDTDQIIPARYLTTTGRTGLGAALFADWRYSDDGTPNGDFPLNGPRAGASRVLVVGRNFGCGSSREHAPWALLDFGFKAIVARSFADIFRANALKNGLLPVALDATAHGDLAAAITRDANAQLSIDLVRQALALGGGPAWPFAIDQFSKRCLLDGVDELGFLLSADAEIALYERVHPARVSTT
ncbi:MAG: 3-isopropylmalate dehydratase small subunit [Gemmatimonadaceae bacterium]